ncbi:hypothetical protein HDU91_001721, partial [Kappamyces sp. JEL0680]
MSQRYQHKAQQQLLILFPDAEPRWIQECVSLHRSKNVARVVSDVAVKITEMPEYPRQRSNCLQDQNKDLLDIVEMFPAAEVSGVRDGILQGKSTWELVKDMLEKPYVQRPEVVPLREQDLFRDPSYIALVKQTLLNEYPFHWESTILAFMAECNNFYPDCVEKLNANRPSSLWRTWLPFTKRHWVDFEIAHPTLLLEMEEMRRSDSLTENDQDIAQSVNEKEYEKTHQLISCGCCFADQVWEDLRQCTEGHLFCKGCISQALSVGMYDSGTLRGRPMLCMASDGEPCQAAIEMDEIERSVSKDLFQNYRATLWEKILAESQLKVISCPFCYYAEVPQPNTLTQVLAGYMPAILAALWKQRASILYTAAILLILCAAVFSSTPVSSTYSATVGVLLVRRLAEQYQDRIRMALQRLALPAWMRKPSPLVFNCQNPTCLKVSCADCQQLWTSPHMCFEKESDSLRLYVEQAMSQAMIRTCPSCSIRFSKIDGCNKMTCTNCRYEMCYVCRQDIGQE